MVDSNADGDEVDEVSTTVIKEVGGSEVNEGKGAR